MKFGIIASALESLHCSNIYLVRSCNFAIFNRQLSGKIHFIVSGCKPEAKSSFETLSGNDWSLWAID